MDDHRPSNAVLRRSALFMGMTDRMLEAIAELATEVGFDPGEVVVREGDAGDAFFVITAGSAVVEQNGYKLRDLHAGDFLGEISLIDGLPRTATVTATESTTALRLARDDFLMDQHSSIRLELPWP